MALPVRTPRRVITLDLPEAMIQWLDSRAAHHTLPRSAYLRLLIQQLMASDSPEAN